MCPAGGALWAVGGGFTLGRGDAAANSLTPVRVGAEGAFKERKVLTVACGAFHTLAVTEDGRLWSWGSGSGGMLGHSGEGHRLQPEEVGAEWFGGAKVVTAACGMHHSAAVTDDGALYTWGRREAPGPDGVHRLTGLGHPDPDDKHVPTLVAPHYLHGTRIGRCLPPSPLHAVAFAMGTHKRLGAGTGASGLGGTRKSRRVEEAEEGMICPPPSAPSPIMLLAGEPGLVRIVVEACQWQPVGVGGNAEGLVRLLGGGRPRWGGATSGCKRSRDQRT
jgi:hypothetical protein